MGVQPGWAGVRERGLDARMGCCLQIPAPPRRLMQQASRQGCPSPADVGLGQAAPRAKGSTHGTLAISSAGSQPPAAELAGEAEGEAEGKGRCSATSTSPTVRLIPLAGCERGGGGEGAA